MYCIGCSFICSILKIFKTLKHLCMLKLLHVIYGSDTDDVENSLLLHICSREFNKIFVDVLMQVYLHYNSLFKYRISKESAF